MFRGNCVDQLVDAIQSLEVGVQPVHEQRIECIARDLRETGVRHRRFEIARPVGNLVPHADDENAVSAEMHSRCQRRRLPHRAVAEILAADVNRGKYHGYGNACHQMIEIEPASNTGAACARPLLVVTCGLEKRCRPRRAVARGRDADGVKPALFDTMLDPWEAHVATQ